MAIFTRDDLLRLLGPHGAPCISILMPTHRHPPGIEQDPIRFKNLLNTAQSLLVKQYSSAEVRALLDPLAELASPRFWQHQMDGLALFCSPDLLAEYRIPMRLPELAIVADSFHVKPLIRFLQTNERYFVLALSQKQVTLYEGTCYALGPVNLAELPASMTQALGIEPQERHMNLRTLGRNMVGPIFHGHGAPAESRKDDLSRFFRSIDLALWEFLREDASPLILAGVDYYFPLYREISRCPNLAEKTVSGNFDHASPDQIHEQVQPVARAIFQEREEAAVSAYEFAHARGLGIEDVNTIARLSVQGRVRQLLLAEGAHAWGRLDRESGKLTPAAAQQDANDDDILDDLAEGVLARGGDVMIVAADRMPRGGVAAAMLRW